MKDTFLEYLQKELLTRQTANERYSLRAYARDLNLEASLLSKMLRSKVSITEKMYERLLNFLTLSEEEQVYYRDQVIKAYEKAQRINQETVILPDDKFLELKDWYHLTIPELTKLDEFKSDPEWIANRLDITVDQAKDSIKKLSALDLIQIDEQGNITCERHPGGVFDIVPENLEHNSEAIRERTKQIMHKYIKFLEGQPSERIALQSYLVIPLDLALIDEIEKEIQIFTQSLVAKIDKYKGKEKSEVYEFSIACFPLTK